MDIGACMFVIFKQGENFLAVYGPIENPDQIDSFLHSFLTGYSARKQRLDATDLVTLEDRDRTVGRGRQNSICRQACGYMTHWVAPFIKTKSPPRVRPGEEEGLARPRREKITF
jgi:hypothetical protein